MLSAAWSTSSFMVWQCEYEQFDWLLSRTSEADQMHFVSGMQMLGHIRERPKQIRRGFCGHIWGGVGHPFRASDARWIGRNVTMKSPSWLPAIF